MLDLGMFARWMDVRHLDKIGMFNPGQVPQRMDYPMTYRPTKSRASHTVPILPRWEENPAWEKGDDWEKFPPKLKVDGVFEMHPDELVKGVSLPTQADREVYESTPWGMSFPCPPHMMHGDEKARHKRIEKIKRRLDCTWKSAKSILNVFKTLEVDGKTAEAIIREIRALGTATERHRALAKYKALADEMEKFTLSEGESDPTEGSSNWMGQFTSVSSHGPFKALLHYENVLDEENGETVVNEVDIDLVELYRKRKGLVDLDDEETVGEHVVEEPGDTERIRQDLFQYHREDSPEPEADWLDSQAPSFHSLLKTIADCKDLSHLGKIGKAVHDGKIRVTKAQSGYFWTKYKVRKANLEQKLFPGKQGNALIDKIMNCTTATELKALGKNLFHFQAGKIPGCTMDAGNWSCVWKHYKKALAVFEERPTSEIGRSTRKAA